MVSLGIGPLTLLGLAVIVGLFYTEIFNDIEHALDEYMGGD